MIGSPLLAACLLVPSPGDDALLRRVEGQIREFRLTAAERRFDEIGWAEDVRSALKLAGTHRRPVFLFTHDGHMNVGRC